MYITKHSAIVRLLVEHDEMLRPGFDLKHKHMVMHLSKEYLAEMIPGPGGSLANILGSYMPTH